MAHPKSYHHTFEDVGELVAAAKRPPVVEGNRSQWNHHTPVPGWYCQDRASVHTMHEGMERLLDPTFPAGVARVERLSAAVDMPSPVSIKRRMTRGDHGDEVDMQRVWTGHLETAWTRAKRMATPNVARVLIGVFVSSSAATDSDRMAWRGVAALALADALEKAGYSVAIRVISRSTLNCAAPDVRADVDVALKREGQPLDLHRAASMIASPLLFRAAILGHNAQCAPFQVREGLSTSNHERASVDASGFDASFIVTRAVESQATAQAWLAKAVQDIEARNSTQGA